MNAESVTLQAGSGRAVELSAGDAIRIRNPAGSQVVDTWAISVEDPREVLSVEHTRAVLSRLVLRVGDVLVTNARRPALQLVADTSPGVHDMLIPACDQARYRMLGATSYHRNCADNFRSAMAAVGVDPQRVPNPLNLFMNVPWTTDGTLEFAAPVSRPDDSVTLVAQRDLWLVMSACPQDMVPVNGAEHQPSDIEYEIEAAFPAS